MAVSITNKLNFWSKNGSNYTTSANLALDSQCTGGFQANDYLKSAIFNGILMETSLVTTALIDALAEVTTSASGTYTIQNTMTPDDLKTVIKNILGGLSVNYAASCGSTNTATSATNISGGAIGSIPYQSDAGTTTFLPKGTSGQILSQGSSNVPQWINVSSLTVSSAITAETANVATNVGDITNDDTGANTTIAFSIGTGANKKSYSKTISVSVPGSVTNAETVTANIQINGTNKAISSIFENNGDAKNATYATSAGSAATATSATTATTATNAGHATTADSATTATSASSAASATYAETAGSAAYATSAGSATQLANDAGSGIQPIYIYEGQPYASSSDVGSANQPVYMDDGTITACSGDLRRTLKDYTSINMSSYSSLFAPTAGTTYTWSSIGGASFWTALTNLFGSYPNGSYPVQFTSGDAQLTYSTGTVTKNNDAYGDHYVVDVRLTKDSFSCVSITYSGYEYSLYVTYMFFGSTQMGKVTISDLSSEDSGGQQAVGYTASTTGAGVTTAETVTTYIQINGTNKTIASMFEDSGAAKNATNAVSANSASTAVSASSASVADNITGGSAGQILYQSANGTTSKITAGTSSQVLTGGTTPAWTNISSLSIGTANNLSGGSAGYIPYQTSPGTTSMLAPGNIDAVLSVSNAGEPTWKDSSDVTVGKASNIAGGSNGQLLYQSGNGVTSKLAIGNAGQFLMVNDHANGFEWSTPTTSTANNIAGGSANDLLYQSAANTTAKLSLQEIIGEDPMQILTGTQSGGLQWVDYQGVIAGQAETTDFTHSSWTTKTKTQHATSGDLSVGDTVQVEVLDSDTGVWYAAPLIYIDGTYPTNARIFYTSSAYASVNAEPDGDVYISVTGWSGISNWRYRKIR